ncbi:hypothetical protein SK128_014977 [Halocaridina rubra]|uniref:DNA polymerase n=1 Tax=Halocaridina rubra TaxID=373956 RepID=A0AAN9A143_HALRR
MKRNINRSTTSRKKRKYEETALREKRDSLPVINFLEGLKIHVHVANFGAGRLKIFEKQIEKYGGELIRDLPISSGEITHIVFEESIDAEKLKKLVIPAHFPNAHFVRCTWLSLSVKNKTREHVVGHEIETGAEKLKGIDSKSTLVIAGCSKNVNSSNHTSLDVNAGNVQPCHCSIECSSGSTRSLQILPENNLEACDKSAHGEQVSHNLVNEGDRLLAPPSEEKCVTNSKLRNFKVKWESNESLTESNKTKYGGERLEPENHENLLKKSTPQGPLNKDKGSTNVKAFSKQLQSKFVCSQPSTSHSKGFNSHITKELEKLAAAYKSKNDTWRAVGYQKAISAIRNYSKEITSREEALGIRGVGARLADKVSEIIESGKLRKVAEVCEDDEAKTLQLFMGVWGAGPTTAKNWYIQGFRTLDDLQTKATLTRHQQIGLKHYSDINSRIPREEVAEIENYVREAALTIKEGLIVMVCGSYRRGKPTCGDVDVLITHPDGQSHTNLFKSVLKKLHENGFLTDDLVTQEDNGNQQKYLGVCKLPGAHKKHRRLDVIVVPYAEYAPATMYFTGSAHFNRSMRLLATKMGMSLSEHGLRAGVVRQGREKLTEGYLLDTPSEESIFAHLGLEYRSPQERDH